MNVGEQTITIAANGKYSVKCPAQKAFFCIATTGVYSVRCGSSEENTVRQAADTWEETKSFGSVTFFNRTGVAITTTFWLGEQRYSAQNVSVSVPAGISVTNSPTVVMSRANTLPLQFPKTVAVPGTPEPLKAVPTLFVKATIIAVKDLAGAANVGVVKLGWSPAVNEQPIVMNPGDQREFTPPQDRQWDLNKLYLDAANAGDGVVIIWS